MKDKNPFIPIVFIASFIFALICYVGIARYINETRSPVARPEWLTLGRNITYFFIICCFACSFLLKRHIQTKSTEKYIKKGKGPDLAILICGLGFFLFPTCIMFSLFILGGFIKDVYIGGILSFGGIIFWSWYQRDVFKLNGLLKSQKTLMDIEQPSIIPTANSEVFFVRPYTIILLLLSIIASGLMGIKIFLIANPIDDYVRQFSSIEMITIPLYVFITICCLVTAILRYRRSSYALFATETISFVLFFWIPFGTASSVYWYWWIREKEKPNIPAAL